MIIIRKPRDSPRSTAKKTEAHLKYFEDVSSGILLHGYSPRIPPEIPLLYDSSFVFLLYTNCTGSYDGP